MGHLKIVFLNANTDRRLLQRLYASWPEYHPTQRVPIVASEAIKNIKDGFVVCLFEITQDILDLLLVEIDKEVKCQHRIGTYNFSTNTDKIGGSFKFLHLIPENVEICEFQNFALTSATGPDAPVQVKEYEFCPNDARPKNDEDRAGTTWYREFTLGDLFEKGATYMHLRINNCEYHVLTTHLGLGDQRENQSRKLLKWVATRLPQGGKTIIGGDFNAFLPNGPYRNQMDLLLNAGFKNLIPFDESTFNPYPYDIRFLLANKEDIERYDEFVNNAKSRDPSSEEVTAFKQFVETVKLKKQIPIALDNVFIKNINEQVQLELNWDSKSDHSASVVRF